jgi:hypothetical protein
MADPKKFLERKNSVWVCRECGHPFGDDKRTAAVMMISHMGNHGASATPIRSHGGGGGGSGGGGGLLDAIGDFIDVITGN